MINTRLAVWTPKTKQSKKIVRAAGHTRCPSVHHVARSRTPGRSHSQVKQCTHDLLMHAWRKGGLIQPLKHDNNTHSLAASRHNGVKKIVKSLRSLGGRDWHAWPPFPQRMSGKSLYFFMSAVLQHPLDRPRRASHFTRRRYSTRNAPGTHVLRQTRPPDAPNAE